MIRGYSGITGEASTLRHILQDSAKLIELKAELHKKQEEFKRAKLYNNLRGTLHRPKKKQTVWDVKNKGVSSRSEKDLEEIAAEENSLSKSKCALEAKALLYEKLTKGTSNLGDEEKGSFLVNFDKKSQEFVNHNNNSLNSSGIIENEKETAETTEDIPAKSRDEEWVDYIDQFGRSRRCIRKDLPENTTLDPNSENNKKLDPMQAHLLSEDMRREHQRKLWEEEEREAMENPVRDIHYQNVLYNEIRSHGVSYYGFSKDEEERSKQEQMLNEMRNQTAKSREDREKLLQKRKSKMDERLAKVRERKKLKVPEPEEHVVETEKNSKQEEALQIERKLAEIEAEHARKQHLRPWDKKKPDTSLKSLPKLSQADWVSKKREERNWEFAPLGAIYKKDQNFEQNSQNNNQTNHVKDTFQSPPSSQSSSTIFYKNFCLNDIPLPETMPPGPDIEKQSHVDLEKISRNESLPQNQKIGDQTENRLESSPQKTAYETNMQSCVADNDSQKFQEMLSEQLSYFKNKC
ncbi:Coiled-coil domain-containing protein 174 [Nymphon striatum]|nr:Coiled-coil domain-containing protein 174 [Nymphon striatum]